MKKLLKLIPVIFLCFNLSAAAEAEWTCGAYMQGDNDLNYTLNWLVNHMVQGCQIAQADVDPNALVNVVVQLDFQDDHKIWRFRITSEGKIEDGSIIGADMGFNPAQEIVDFSYFLKTNFPARKYALMLYNHGSGVKDYKDDMVRNFELNKTEDLILQNLKNSDLKNFDSRNLNLKNLDSKNLDLKDLDLKNSKLIKSIELEDTSSKEESSFVKTTADRVLDCSRESEEITRGILYDHTQNTCLTNPAMKRAFLGVRDILGQKLDLLILDACLMSMIEVYNQIKDSVKYCVATQQVKYAGNWRYRDVIAGLIENPIFFDGLVFGTFIVKLYEDGSNYAERTAACIKLENINILKNNVNAVSDAILKCAKYNKNKIMSAIRQTRNECPPFHNIDYIDLYTFYDILKGKLIILHEQASYEPTVSCCGLIDNSAKYLRALRDTIDFINAGMDFFPEVVCCYTAGPDRQDAHGLSIYFPDFEKKGIHGSYYDTDFANGRWIKILKLFF